MQVLDREELQKFLIQAQADGYYELFLRRHFFRLRLMIFTRDAVLITEAALLRAAVVRNKN